MINRNRWGNIDNPYQGSAKKVLCVCSAGMLRSPTAANVLYVDGRLGMLRHGKELKKL